MKGDWDDPLTVWDHFFWDEPDAPPPPPGKRRRTKPRIMSSNPTPDNNDILRALADHLADGCHTHETTLGIKQNTEAAMRAAIAALDAAETQLGLKRKDVDDSFTAVEAADAAGETTLSNCKLRLAKVLGQRWNAGWEATGFPHRSTGVPRTQDERFTLLKDVRNYFTAMPAHESVDMEATAALCDAAWTAISDARDALGKAESAQTSALSARTAAANVLRSRVRGLINELGQVITDADPRWEEFGLNIPASPSAPLRVETVALEALSNHRINATWSYAVRAERFRVETMIVGVDGEFVGRGSFRDLEAMLKGFTAGQTVKVRVIAANDGGDAPPSPEAEVVVT